MTAPSPDPAKTNDTAEKPMSKGERIFNWLVYGGVAGVGVFVVTLPIAFWTRYGGGAGWWKRSTQWLEKKGMNAYTSEEVLNTAVLGSIGNFAIIPVKILEEYKHKLIPKLNKKYGSEIDKQLAEHDPPQTWWTLIKGRVAAYVAVFASLQAAVKIGGGERFDAFKNNFAEYIVCKPLGKPTHIGGMETKAFRYGKIAALDVFCAASAATLLYLASRFFAKEDKNQSAKNDSPAPAPLAARPPMAESAKRFTANMPTPSKRYVKAVDAEKSPCPSCILGA